MNKNINILLRKITKAKDLLFGGGFDFAQPEAIQVETVLKCNLKCTMCDEEMKNRPGAENLNFEKFKYIINQFPYAHEINFTGYGETLLNTDIYKMIEYSKEKGIATGFSTNCTLLNKENTIKIIKSGLDSIIFSIDSGIEDKYNYIRRGANFRMVVNNVKTFMELKDSLKSPIQVEIYSVIIFPDLNELNLLIDLAFDLGVKKIKIRGLVDHKGKSVGYDKLALYHPENREISNKKLKIAKEYAEKKGIILSYPLVYPNEKFICRMPYARPFISVEGFVTPCCVQGMDPRGINFGNIYENEYRKIKNSKKFKIFRKQLLTKNPPYICRYCPRYKGMG